MVDLNLLRKFIAQAHLAGYASGDEDSFRKENDGSRTVTFRDGDYSYHDNYFGGEPYGGREVVFLKDKPVFMMVYYGRVTDEQADKHEIYAFLRQAMSSFDNGYPYRGPKLIKKAINSQEFKYRNEWKGEIDCFSGQEEILISGRSVYEAKYQGGLIDQ